MKKVKSVVDVDVLVNELNNLFDMVNQKIIILGGESVAIKLSIHGHVTGETQVSDTKVWTNNVKVDEVNKIKY
jgi:hypothetical protein